MCSVILRVTYAAQSEPRLLVEFDSEESAQTRLAEFQKLDTVSSVSIFRNPEKYVLTRQWEKQA